MWLIQELINKYNPNENTYLKYREALQELDLPYNVIYYKSDGSLSLLDNEYIEVPNGVDEVKKLIDKGVFFLGSVKLDDEFRLSPKYKLTPDFDLDFNNILEYIPEKYLLNIPKVKGLITEIYPIDESFMMRPLISSKTINVGVYTEGQFYAMRKNAIEFNDEKFLNTQFMMSPVQNINSEYRFFIIGGKIVTYSTYIHQGRFNININVPDNVIEFAQFILDNFKIPIHTVMDVAIMEDGSLKVIEFNTIIASGLYNCDAKKIIIASEEYIKGK